MVRHCSPPQWTPGLPLPALQVLGRDTHITQRSWHGLAEISTSTGGPCTEQSAWHLGQNASPWRSRDLGQTPVLSSPIRLVALELHALGLAWCWRWFISDEGAPFSCPLFRWPVSHHPAMYLHIILPLRVREQSSSGRNRNDSNNLLPRRVIIENQDTESDLKGIPSPEGASLKGKKVVSFSILPAQTPICLTVRLEWAQISLLETY